MVAGGLTARAPPRSRSHAMFSIPEEIADCVCCDPFRINNLARDNIRGCRFAQPPATFYHPYRGNEAMMHGNKAVDLLNHAWSEHDLKGTLFWIYNSCIGSFDGVNHHEIDAGGNF